MRTFMQHNAAVKADALPWLIDAADLGDAPAWMKALRATGAEAFVQTGLPAPTWEGWQNTSLRALKPGFRLVGADVKDIPAPLLSSARIVVVNGKFHAENLPKGVTVKPLHEADPALIADVGDLAENPFKALNTAYMRDGFVLETKGEIETPIEILFYTVGDNVASHPRAFYHIGKNSGVTIIERHMGVGTYFANTQISVLQEADSRLKLYRIQEESETAAHFSSTVLRAQKNASFEGFAYAVGALLAREEYRAELIDSDISSIIKGVYLLRGRQLHDFAVMADHFEPNGKSLQGFKGVVDDQACAVFQGKVKVRRSAQQTDGAQSHHALLLSRQAEAHFKPELEIYADNVKCGHGATSGQIDDKALFYLRSRGVPEVEARALLVEAFLQESLSGISYQPLRDVLEGKVRAWLA